MKVVDVVCIILGRGGSKGIPNKNLIDFSGEPLIVWTVKQMLEVVPAEYIFVSSDDPAILDLSATFGVNTIQRPDYLCSDEASSESGWLHSIQVIENDYKIDPLWILAPQATSPIRNTSQIFKLLSNLDNLQRYNSFVSVVKFHPCFVWEFDESDGLSCKDYGIQHRPRRQEVQPTYIENGSLFLFKTSIFRLLKSRFIEPIGPILMDKYSLFEIDEVEDIIPTEKVFALSRN